MQFGTIRHTFRLESGPECDREFERTVNDRLGEYADDMREHCRRVGECTIRASAVDGKDETDVFVKCGKYSSNDDLGRCLLAATVPNEVKKEVAVTLDGLL